MQIELNGEPRELSPGMTVADLITDLGMKPKFVAVERNLQLIPRAEHARCVLEPGDRLEVVTLVGGG